jgi:hypothetical protein
VNAIILFVICTAVNVILSTIKSIATIKGGKFMAALMNALTYGFYSWVIILTTIDNLSTVSKMLITAACNFVGVYLVKLIEEKTRKDKIWQLSITVPQKYIEALHHDYTQINLPHNYIDVVKWGVFTIYCETQKDTTKALEIAKQYGAKCFAAENKLDL